MGVKHLFIPLAFIAGISVPYFSNFLRSQMYYAPEKGYFERPFDLKIVYQKSISGRIMTYLVDTKANESHKIGPGMYVGGPLHRLESLLNLPYEYIEEKHQRLLKLILK